MSHKRPQIPEVFLWNYRHVYIFWKVIKFSFQWTQFCWGWRNLISIWHHNPRKMCIFSTFFNKNRTKTSLSNNKTDSKLLQKYCITNANIYPRYYFKKHYKCTQRSLFTTSISYVNKEAHWQLHTVFSKMAKYWPQIFVIKFLTSVSFKCWPNTQTLCDKVWSKGSSTIQAAMDNLGSNSRFPSVYPTYNKLCTSIELFSCLLLVGFAPKSAFL